MGLGIRSDHFGRLPNGFHGHPRPPLTSVMQHLDLSSKVIRFSGDWKDSRHGDIGGFVGGLPTSVRRQVLGKRVCG